MFSDPKNNIRQFQLEPGINVADLGAGSGFYSLAVAKEIGEGGKVYAVDIQKDLLQKIKNAANEEHIYNIEVIWGDIESENGTKLKDESMDAVIISNILFQIEKKEDFLKEARRILKPKGKALFIEWKDSYAGMGPSKEKIFVEKEAKDIFDKIGFYIEKEISAGEHHYGFILRKK